MTKDLIERLEAATGADRELDLCVSQVCGAFYSYTDTPNGPENIACRPYTASVDASLALVGEKLPGCEWEIGKDALEGGHYARIFSTASPGADCDGAPTPALAVLIALFRALETK